MKVDLRPEVAAVLEEQVAAGLFPNIEAALSAAVLGEDPQADLSWAKLYLDEADRDIEAGRTLSEEETYTDLERRFGKI